VNLKHAPYLIHIADLDLPTQPLAEVRSLIHVSLHTFCCTA
jgi:hypothetical protein